ncbi:hypothetical protein [Flagellimonas onchidii]|uniref:hypothetical protein n=1 Tax=Flagellimonas onchidii TaxID=2562684 RepID=UPI0010A64B2E|nr:hypothetical protein [Allomuricauda onchidii]
MKHTLVVSVLILLLFLSCANKEELDIAPIVKEYFETYSGRKDFKKLISFYDDDIILEDI